MLRFKSSVPLSALLLTARSHTGPRRTRRLTKVFLKRLRPLCAFVSFVVKSPWLKLLIRDFHLINVNAIGRCRAVAVQLNSIGELVIHGAGEKRIVRNIHRSANAVDGKRVMQHGVGRCVIVIFGGNVVPGAGSESG